MKNSERIQETKEYIESKIKFAPTVGLVLGSGLGVLAEEIDNATYINYDEIPHFPVSTVLGHQGRLVIGELKGKKVIAMQGRFHFYEGHSLDSVTYPIRIMKALGVTQLLVTNAAGGINPNFKPGDLMIINDHINMTSQNPLIGPNEGGVRFPDMSEAYSKGLRQLAKTVAEKTNIELVEGVYAGMLGPSYETPAEIKLLSVLGADAVGMSTVPEVIVARHAELEVLGISCISNMAAGISKVSLTHEEVMETTENIKAQFLLLVKEIVSEL
ncbi:purine-nucleoside phosphorylase [Metabacillus litoralis]|uniref:purine-nucleoside phosphorylase n=1 Tax=Metabacillus TaxID=2675233 RepID=UPI001B9E604D|nr:purine-nucleoside phosphorylase [Metabacillus litoralis]UHA61476.1 purine-nucleoside phosphorylase [Metabacillus litoralis]